MKKKRIFGFVVSALIICSIMLLIDKGELFALANNKENERVSETEGNRVFNCLNEVLAEDENESQPVFSDFIENYGGGYIDGNRLVIYVKGGVNTIEKLSEKMQAKGINPEQYNVINAKYSYSELQEQIELLWNFRNMKVEEGEKWAKSIIQVAINQENNCIDIFVTEDLDISSHPEMVELLDRISYRIIISEDKNKREDVLVKPGMGISTGGSIGFRCKLNGVKGFVTAVHTQLYASINPVTYGGSTIGNITLSHYGNGSDFAFVATNSDCFVGLLTNTNPAYALHSSHYVVSLPTNYTVYMAGKKSTSVRQGSVVYYSSSVSQDSGTDWLICSYQCQQGDSGGCVFANVNGDNCVLAVHDGAYGSDAYATKYTRMQSECSGLAIY